MAFVVFARPTLAFGGYCLLSSLGGRSHFHITSSTLELGLPGARERKSAQFIDAGFGVRFDLQPFLGPKSVANDLHYTNMAL